jgi:hypothetical protein
VLALLHLTLTVDHLDYLNIEWFFNTISMSLMRRLLVHPASHNAVRDEVLSVLGELTGMALTRDERILLRLRGPARVWATTAVVPAVQRIAMRRMLEGSSEPQRQSALCALTALCAQHFTDACKPPRRFHSSGLLLLLLREMSTSDHLTGEVCRGLDPQAHHTEAQRADAMRTALSARFVLCPLTVPTPLPFPLAALGLTDTRCAFLQQMLEQNSVKLKRTGGAELPALLWLNSCRRYAALWLLDDNVARLKRGDAMPLPRENPPLHIGLLAIQAACAPFKLYGMSPKSLRHLAEWILALPFGP